MGFKYDCRLDDEELAGETYEKLRNYLINIKYDNGLRIGKILDYIGKPY